MQDQLGKWGKFWGSRVNLDNLCIPQREADAPNLIVVASGATIKTIWDQLAVRVAGFGAHLPQELIDVKHEREPGERSYAVWTCSTDLKTHCNISAEQLGAQRLIGITLLEQLVLDLFDVVHSGRNFAPIRPCIACAGTTRKDGNIPLIWWNGDIQTEQDWMCIEWQKRTFAHPNVLQRYVVS